jgi:hypothetical protein
VTVTICSKSYPVGTSETIVLAVSATHASAQIADPICHSSLDGRGDILASLFS